MQTLDVPQGSEEWHAHRAGVPTVSEFGRFITPTRGDYSKQAAGYIAELIVESVEGPKQSIITPAMARGMILEPEARRWYEMHADTDVEQIGLILNKGAGYSPDGKLPAMYLEIKCPEPKTHVSWLLSGELPNEHKAQVHGSMVVGEADACMFLSYCPGYRPLLLSAVRTAYTEKVEDALLRFNAELAEAKARVLQ